MGFVSGLLGGSTGAGYQAKGPSQADIDAANKNVGGAFSQQQNFVNALAGQNGLANQSQVYNQQQGLATQLQGVANGTGPNPAQAALNQATGQNVANQAALMAGQRGSSSNVGLMARQAAQQGANIQQQAVGQGATMQAQQQLAGMQMLQGQQANMANMANTQIGQQQAGLTGLNQNALQNQANVYGLQSNANSANASVAGTNAGSQANLMGGVMGGIGSAMNMFGGSGGGAAGGAGGDIFSGGGDAIGGGSAASSLGDMGTMLAAQGGVVQMAAGGQPSFDPLMSAQNAPQVQTLDQPKTSGPQSNVGKMFNDSGPSAPAKSASSSGAGMSQMLGTGLKLGEKLVSGIAKSDFIHGLGSMVSGIGSGVTNVAGAGDAIVGGAPAAAEGLGSEAAVMAAAEGGQVPALVSPGEIRIKRKDVKQVAEGKKSPLAGEKIKGKPKVGGAVNSYANDTIPKSLNEGDIILPRSVTQSANPHWAAHKFVSAIMAQKKHGKK